MSFDPEKIRREFPLLARTMRGKPLVYLDSAATAQKPEAVIRALSKFYRTKNANIHRGVYQLSEEATAAYEAARERMRAFLNARSAGEIVFVRGATEAINLVAQSWGRAHLKAGEAILLSGMEHHANIVPWYLLAGEKKLELRVVPLDDRGDLRLEEYVRLLAAGGVRLVAVTQQSNALGTINPVKEMIAQAHAHGALVLVDGAQSAVHQPIDARELDCDFFVFSGHKLYGPSGCGVLYGKAEILATMPPWQGGGDMIRSVTFEKITFQDPPARFEAGTPAIAEAVGLGEAVAWLAALDRAAATAHETRLVDLATARLKEIPGLSLIGAPRRRAAVVSFTLASAHPHDIGTILDSEGVAIRAGHHCAQPVMEHFGVPATVRASFAVYNTEADVEALVRGMRKVKELFG